MKYARVALVLSFTFSTARSQDNGIGVGKPKVFDNRTLTIMLQQLNDQLRTVQVVDQSKLAASLSLQQGFQSRDTSQSLSVTTPITTTKQTFDASNKPTGTEKDTTPGGGGNPPALPTLQADPSGFAPQYGENAGDLLSDQVNLSYQIFSVRMLLERSLSDRLYPDSNGTRSAPRLQAVIGFNVSVNPPRDERGHAAVVEVTVVPEGTTEPVSLVSLMPQEKTYNSAALSKSATAFGGSAVAKVVTIGYSYQRRSTTLYLFRDADTISFERTLPQSDPERAVTFGWEFRPVLGRESVSPGDRQMFAVVSVPAGDSSRTDLATGTPRTGFPLTVRVRTYWKKYDRDKLTTKSEERDVRMRNSPLRVPYTAESQYDLAPKIKRVAWAATGPDSAVATVDGENFFSGTSVVLGGQTFASPTDGLILKSDQSFQLNTSITALGLGDAVLDGRYGPSRLIVPDGPPNAAPPGIFIYALELDKNTALQLWPLRLFLQTRNGPPLDLTSLRRDYSDPIITVAGKLVAGPYVYRSGPCDDSRGALTCVKIEALAPADLLKTEAPISIRFPLLGPAWADTRLYYDPSLVTSVSRVGTSGGKTTLAISGEKFDNTAKVQLDHVYLVASGELSRPSSTLMTLDVDTATLGQFKSLIVFPTGEARPTVLDIPPVKPDAPKAKLDDPQPQPQSVLVGSAQGVTFTGTGLSAITLVKFGYESLAFKVADDAKSIQVFLTRRVTETDGIVQVLLTSADGSVLPATIVVKPGVPAAGK